MVTTHVRKAFLSGGILHRSMASPIMRCPSSLLIWVERSTLDLTLTSHLTRTVWLVRVLESIFENICWSISLVIELLISHLSLFFLPTRYSWTLLVRVDICTYTTVSMFLVSFSWFEQGVHHDLFSFFLCHHISFMWLVLQTYGWSVARLGRHILC